MKKLSPYLLWIFLSIFFQWFATLCAKQAALTSESGNLISMVYNPWYIAEIVSLLFQTITWFITLKHFHLSFAYPFMSSVFF